MRRHQRKSCEKIKNYQEKIKRKRRGQVVRKEKRKTEKSWPKKNTGMKAWVGPRSRIGKTQKNAWGGNAKQNGLPAERGL